MSKSDNTTQADAAEASATPTKDEPSNVAVTVINNRTSIRRAVCAAGPLDFLLTMSEATQLRDLGLVTITGIRS